MSWGWVGARTAGSRILLVLIICCCCCCCCCFIITGILLHVHYVSPAYTPPAQPPSINSDLTFDSGLHPSHLLAVTSGGSRLTCISQQQQQPHLHLAAAAAAAAAAFSPARSPVHAAALHLQVPADVEAGKQELVETWVIQELCTGGPLHVAIRTEGFVSTADGRPTMVSLVVGAGCGDDAPEPSPPYTHPCIDTHTHARMDTPAPHAHTRTHTHTHTPSCLGVSGTSDHHHHHPTLCALCRAMCLCVAPNDHHHHPALCVLHVALCV